MPLIHKSKPWSYLWILVFHVVICIVLLFGSLCLDLYLYKPSPEQPGFPFPLFMMITMVAEFFASIIVIIVVTVLIVIHRRQ